MAQQGDLEVKVGDKLASPEAQKRVRDALKKQIQEQLQNEISTASTGGIKPAVHGSSGVST